MVPSTRHTRPWTRSMASATVGTNFSTTARTIGQAGHETQHGKRRDIPQGTPANSSAENTCDLGRSVQPHDFGRPLPCSTARSTHCDLSHQLLHLRQHQTGGTVMATVLPGVENSLEGSLEFSRRTVAFCCDTPEPNDLPIRAPPDGLPQFVGTSALDR